MREPNSIGSYAALAAIAIQSNQNDQHGGQSIPDFDYAMAPGVKKTYRSVYAQNLAKAVSFLHDGEDGEKRVTEILSRIEAEKGLSPSMEEDGPYLEEEKKNLEYERNEKKAAKN